MTSNKVPTNEQIIREAKRRWEAAPIERRWSVKDYIIEVVRENWTPPEPVDPDLMAFREWCRIREGAGDPWMAFLAGARMAREQERERADMPIRIAEELAGRFRHLRLSLPLGVRAQFGVKWDLDETLLNAVESEIAKYEEGGR